MYPLRQESHEARDGRAARAGEMPEADTGTAASLGSQSQIRGMKKRIISNMRFTRNQDYFCGEEIR